MTGKILGPLTYMKDQKRLRVKHTVIPDIPVISEDVESWQLARLRLLASKSFAKSSKDQK